MKTYRRILGSFASSSQSLVERAHSLSVSRTPLHGFHAASTPQPTRPNRPGRKSRLFPSRPTKLAASALALATIATSQAVIVSTSSVDFLGDFQAGALSSSTIAGVVPADQWGTANGNFGFLSHPDTLGGDMINYEWDAPASAVIGGSTPTPGDNLMMEGFITSQGGATGVSPASLRVNSIDLGALGWTSYDVFVYSDTGTNGGTKNISLFSPGATTYSHTESVPGFGVGGFNTYLDSQSSGAGNYVRYDGLTSSSFNVTITHIPGSGDMGALNGIQIVGHKNIPEPSTALLAFLSSTLLLRRKRG